MPNYNLSSAMMLPVPQVGAEPGPQYAIDINNCLTIIDQHDHAPGRGIQITPTGLDINSDLTFISNNATDLRSARFTAQGSPLAELSDLGCLYVSGVDLYYNDENGNQVRITQSGAVAGTPGSIANLVAPASASYVSGTSTFVWQSDVVTPANLDAASITLRNLSANSLGLTLSPPTLGSDYTITLPQLPASSLPVVISSSGAMGAQQLTLAMLNSTVQNQIVRQVPTRQTLTSASGTYTTPAGVAYVRIRMIGAGGGGGNGSAGGSTTFGTSLLTATGGGTGRTDGSTNGTQGGLGGTATINSPAVGTGFTGGSGSGGSGNNLGSNATASGGAGASSPFGGGGGGGSANAEQNHTGISATANTGAGGGGGSTYGESNGKSGAGGGAGGYIEALINSPSSTYAYTVGVGGSGGTVGGASLAGGDGGSGVIIVDEFYGY